MNAEIVAWSRSLTPIFSEAHVTWRFLKRHLTALRFQDSSNVFYVDSIIWVYIFFHEGSLYSTPLCPSHHHEVTVSHAQSFLGHFGWIILRECRYPEWVHRFVRHMSRTGQAPSPPVQCSWRLRENSEKWSSTSWESSDIEGCEGAAPHSQEVRVSITYPPSQFSEILNYSYSRWSSMVAECFTTGNCFSFQF